MTYGELLEQVKVWGHRRGLPDDLSWQMVRAADDRIRGDFWGMLPEPASAPGEDDPLPLSDGLYLAATSWELRRYLEDEQGMMRADAAYEPHRQAALRLLSAALAAPGRAPVVAFDGGFGNGA